DCVAIPALTERRGGRGATRTSRLVRRTDSAGRLPPARHPIPRPTAHAPPVRRLILSINTHLAPFDNVLVREALNYAIDRRAIAQMYGGPAFATPTCQPLAPGL